MPPALEYQSLSAVMLMARRINYLFGMVAKQNSQTDAIILKASTSTFLSDFTEVAVTCICHLDLCENLHSQSFGNGGRTGRGRESACGLSPSSGPKSDHLQTAKSQNSDSSSGSCLKLEIGECGRNFDSSASGSCNLKSG